MEQIIYFLHRSEVESEKLYLYLKTTSRRTGSTRLQRARAMKFDTTHKDVVSKTRTSRHRPPAGAHCPQNCGGAQPWKRGWMCATRSHLRRLTFSPAAQEYFSVTALKRSASRFDVVAA